MSSMATGSTPESSGDRHSLTGRSFEMFEKYMSCGLDLAHLRHDVIRYLYDSTSIYRFDPDSLGASP
ncbi:hypothetical protein Tco_0732040 [Tanacetum coccineum]